MQVDLKQKTLANKNKNHNLLLAHLKSTVKHFHNNIHTRVCTLNYIDNFPSLTFAEDKNIFYSENWSCLDTKLYTLGVCVCVCLLCHSSNGLCAVLFELIIIYVT